MSVRASIAELLALLLAWGVVLSFLPGCENKQTGTPSGPITENNSPPETLPALPTHDVRQQATSASDGTAPELGPLSEAVSDVTSYPGPSAGALGGAAVPEDEHASPHGSFSHREVSLEPLRKVNEAAIDAAGLRRLSGKHLTLYTDLPIDAELAQLPQVFDLAFPQWCQKFGLDPAKFANWKMRGSLIGDRAKFLETELLPADLPGFQNGYARAGELWLYEQPSPYYRRHLLLHEGTHGFMEMLMGGCGPPWYMEGLAELLATHRWQAGQLTLNVMPDSKEAFQMLGRIKIVQTGTAAAGKPKSLVEILNYSSRAHLENEPYGWCWALAAFLDRHPKYQQRFERMKQEVLNAKFNQQLLKAYQPDWRELNTEWQLFAGTLEHGHDIAQTAIDFQTGTALTTGEIQLTVDAARGWQATPVQLLAGQTYQVTASGQFEIARTDQPWISEPGGVTIRYYRGQPLGKLLAAVVNLEEMAADGSPTTPLLSPLAIGLSGAIKPERTGTLYLQLNDSAGERQDNSGLVQVTVAVK